MNKNITQQRVKSVNGGALVPLHLPARRSGTDVVPYDDARRELSPEEVTKKVARLNRQWHAALCDLHSDICEGGSVGFIGATIGAVSDQLDQSPHSDSISQGYEH